MITKLTHNSFSAFFSGTDTNELETNCEHYNYYLSLIVAFDGNYKCKIAIPSNSEITFTNKITNDDGELVDLITKMSKPTILVGDVIIEKPVIESVNNWLSARIGELKNKVKKVIPTYLGGTYSKNNKNPYPYSYNKSYELDLDNEYNKIYEKYASKSLVSSSKKQNRNKSDFLVALMLLDEDIFFKPISSAIKEICDQYAENKLDLEVYKELVFENVETIYNAINEDKSLGDLDFVCRQSISILENNKKLFVYPAIYEAIKDVLKTYAK